MHAGPEILPRTLSKNMGAALRLACCIIRPPTHPPTTFTTACTHHCPSLRCRGTEKVRLTDFPTAVRYMEFTQAVAESCQSGRAVALPLIPSV